MRIRRVSTKFLGVLGAVVVAASLAVGWFVISGAEDALFEQTRGQLEAERASRARFLALYFKRLNDQLGISSRQLVTQIALRDLPGSPEKLNALFRPYAAGLVEAFDYSNIALVAPDGRVAYSLVESQRADVARAFTAASASSAGQAHFIDFEIQDSSGQPAAFAAMPVFDTNTNAKLGVLVFQLPVDEISDIVTDTAGFGKTGETYLIGPDLLMRTNSRFETQPTALRQKVLTPAASLALKGESGTINQVDYRGHPVIASYAPFDAMGVRWAIVAKIDVDEALAPARLFQSRMLLLFVVVGLIAGAVLWEALRRIVLTPVSALAAGAQRVSAHDYARPVGLRSRDELGQLGDAFDGMMSSVGAHVDQLQRARAAEALAYRLLEAAPDGVVAVDHQGRIGVVNRAAEQLFGYQRDELIGQPIELLVPEQLRPRHVTHRQAFLANATVREMGVGVELEGRRKDGSLVPVEISLSPVEGASGTMTVAAVRDIRERRKAQRDLKESEERLVAAARGANLGLWDVDPRESGVTTNAIFESQLGYAPLAIRETDQKWAKLRGGLAAWVELLHPDDRARVTAMIERFLAGEAEIYKAEQRVLKPDGTYAWILSVGNSIDRDADGKPLRVNGVHIDISDIKALESLRDGLVHMIVHDLRSPLTGVMGYLDLLKVAESASAADRAKFVDEAYGSASEMSEMISSLLDINRLEANEMPVDRQQVDLRETAADAVRSLGGLIVGRTVTVAAGEPVVSNCDPALIRRVIGNLLGNALKFTPESGSITINVTRAGGKPAVEVADTGPGIPADFIPRIFDKFSQAGEGRRKKRYSTGLGLAFCKLAVEAHRGTIGVTSEVGVGSRFRFELPE